MSNPRTHELGKWMYKETSQQPSLKAVLVQSTGLRLRHYTNNKKGEDMKYSVRYLDVKHRPMFRIEKGLNVPVTLAKVAFWTVAAYVLCVALVYFIENITYWGK